MSMQPFSLQLLFLPGILIFLFTASVSAYVTRSIIFSVLAAVVKSGIFFIYFGVFFDGTFTFLDDLSYLSGGSLLLDEGFGLSDIDEKWQFLLMVAGGNHFVYYVLNAYAFKLFGFGYFAPVAINVMITVFIATIGAKIAEREFKIFRNWKKLFFAFLLFHPNILAWSNVMNGKDTLVLMMHVLLLLSASFHFEGRRRLALAIAAPVALICLFLRFYVPIFFAGAFLAQYLTKTTSVRVLPSLTAFGIITYFVFNSLVGHLVPGSFLFLSDSLVNPVLGFFKMILSPIPFNTDENYKFLDIPALLHWFMLPFSVYGAFFIIRSPKSKFMIFFCFYLALFFTLYSINDELTGPRHRLQLDFAWATIQFIGIKKLFVSGFGRSSGPRVRTH